MTERSRSSGPCKTFGCRNITFDGKPFCHDHVEKNPRAAEIMSRLALKAAESDAVAERGRRAVDLSGPVIEDMVTSMAWRGRTTQREAATEAGLSMKATLAFLNALVSAGVLLARPGRKATTYLVVYSKAKLLVPGLPWEDLEKEAAANVVKYRPKAPPTA